MSPSILVVEDDAVIARDIKQTLEGFGYVVPSPVASGAQALAAISAHRPDLVLMDIRIQGEMDGIQTAAVIGKVHGTPVVYLTSHSDDVTLERAKMTGAYGYVVKPFQHRDLRASIEVALQKREFDQHREEEQCWFAATLKSLGDAVIATDLAHRITFMNAVAERATGWALKDAVGKHLGEVMVLVDQKPTVQVSLPHEDARREGFTVELQVGTLSAKDGGKRSIADSKAPIIDDAGKTLGRVVAFRDITELRRLEERLAATERLASIATLSAGMAHEINNPQTYVLANVTFAVEELAKVKERLQTLAGTDNDALTSRLGDITDALGDAREGSERIDHIVRDLKRFGRLDKLDSKVLELSEVLDSAIRTTENSIRSRAAVRREYGTTPYIEAAESQLGQVFSNLLVNASEAFAEDKGKTRTIVVATYTDETGRAVAEVRDTGRGIPAEDLRSIFDPFFTTKPVGQGLGLGLSISHSIVQSLGGEISVDSNVGKGTTFRVSLLAARKNESKTNLTPLEGLRRRARVLVIDDEPAIGRVVGRLLESEHDVLVLADAGEALTRIMAGEVFDIVFCDLMMPGMTGMDFYTALRESNPALAQRVVFVTGGAFTVRTEEFLATTTNVTLSKPFDQTALRRIVTDYMNFYLPDGVGADL